MPLGQALLLEPYAAFMTSLEAYLSLAPSTNQKPKESSYLDTLIGIFTHPFPASPSESLEKPTQPQSLPIRPQPHPQTTPEPEPEHPDATPEFSITPFPPRKPLSTPYLSPLIIQAQPNLPHIDLSLQLRKLSAHNLRKHKHALLSLSPSRSHNHSKRHARSYPLSPPSSSSAAAGFDYDYGSASAYDAWFDSIPSHLGLRIPHAQAPRLVLAIFSVFVLALMGQLVLVWMMTREWGVFAS